MGWSGENLMMLQDKLFVKWGRREISRSGDFSRRMSGADNHGLCISSLKV